jgi:hypothetical protein
LVKIQLIDLFEYFAFEKLVNNAYHQLNIAISFLSRVTKSKKIHTISINYDKGSKWNLCVMHGIVY